MAGSGKITHVQFLSSSAMISIQFQCYCQKNILQQLHLERSQEGFVDFFLYMVKCLMIKGRHYQPIPKQALFFTSHCTTKEHKNNSHNTNKPYICRVPGMVGVVYVTNGTERWHHNGLMDFILLCLVHTTHQHNSYHLLIIPLSIVITTSKP